MIQKINHQHIKEALGEAYIKFKDNAEGKNADYIPYLAQVPSNLFGISACLPDGEVIAVGDTDYKFGIESVSKVPTAILAMNQYSAQEVLQQIGADATGLPFNSIIAILLEKDHPSTPLVNAGAISACSMIKPIGDSDAKWRAIRNFVEGLCGSGVAVIDELYHSETATNFNNRSIAWLLRNYNRIYDDPEIALDLYTRQCSIGITARQLAIAAATIALGGVNPVTKLEVFKPNLSPHITSMMATVGFYEHTGDWLFTTGLPAKTGVGGGIMGVIPGVMGISAFAPPLDESGNSVKAQKALSYIVNRLNLNIFSTTRCVVEKQEPARV
ncbi:MAG: glutaminase A [Alistipes sp.]